ncbi:methyltransferase domain-containing protein [Candidatus Saccharibacteria bacterium]|nr:methyltransferase domain-containing protein [Candidatus Saccharibacteria bacterium]
MQYLAILGREPKLSLAELEALFGAQNVSKINRQLAKINTEHLNLSRLGGTIKAAEILEQPLADYFANLPAGKITLGFSDYSKNANTKKTWQLALKYKNLLKRHGRNVRLIPATDATISSATAHHNQLGEKLNHIEIIKFDDIFASSIGTQNITAYAKRDQQRPARDAFVGMLPPKLAQIIINLATTGAKTGTVLDPFCGTGVVLQEAALMGYSAYGSDLSEKMVKYSQRNLDWLVEKTPKLQKSQAPAVNIEVGDATDHSWQSAKIDFVASEIYLGHPLSAAPADIKFKELKQDAESLLRTFLKNIAPQITSGTQLALATPAWLRPDGSYKGVDILDEIDNLGYNAIKYLNATQSDLLYHRENQIVARQIIVLRKK